MERMERGADLLKMPFPNKKYLIERIRNAISESEIEDAYVKLCLLSEGGSAFYKSAIKSQVLVIVKEYVQPKQFVKLKVNSFRRISESPLLKIKSMNYLENVLARREALDSGFDEALFVNEKGEVTECSASNLFWFKDDTLFAPSEGCGLLAGTTRDLVFALMPNYNIKLLEGKFLLKDIKQADFVFITNSLIGCILVSEIEGNFYKTEHPLFLKMQNALLQKLKWI
jgi:4-amino-4-deoxychorismate lyase